MRKFKKLTMTLALLIAAVGGAWAQTETLLTTITATGTEQASYSTANVATVSFTNLPDYSSHYNDSWGWWGCGWSATVNAAEGYTITKCVFYDNTDHTATDSEAPFVVETTENDKQPKVNGNYIYQYSSSAGIKKIEVYGYQSAPEPAEWELTPDETGKTWTLDKMPASNVELQVEYYAESHLFLSKEALADKAKIAVKNGETDVVFDADGKSENTVTEGNTVTAKFTGKKVLGMKVEKKAPLIVNPVVGQIIGSDGKNYAYGSLPTGVTPVAKICYVSGSNGLALALTDEEGKMNWSTAQTTCAAHTPAFTGGTWKLASKDEWSNMISAADSYTNLRDGFSSVGGTNMQQDAYYWSSTEYSAINAWRFKSTNGRWFGAGKENATLVRACLAF